MEKSNTLQVGGENRAQKLRKTLSGIKTGLAFRSSSRSSARTGSEIRNAFSRIPPFRDDAGTELQAMKIEVSLSGPADKWPESRLSQAPYLVLGGKLTCGLYSTRSVLSIKARPAASRPTTTQT